MNSIPIAGLAEMKGSIPYLSKSCGAASIIDNGVGSYQIVLDRVIDCHYSCLLTPRETSDERPVFAMERNDFERSEIDFLVELKDKEGHPVDSDFNFAIIEAHNG